MLYFLHIEYRLIIRYTGCEILQESSSEATVLANVDYTVFTVVFRLYRFNVKDLSLFIIPS